MTWSTPKILRVFCTFRSVHTAPSPQPTSLTPDDFGGSLLPRWEPSTAEALLNLQASQHPPNSPG